MIRRHFFWLRALLMAADALIAGGLLLGLSAWRFGDDWAVWWRVIIPEPEAFLLLYAVTWVGVLTSVGLYRPRARWSMWSELRDVVRATIIMALLTLSVLFLFHLPEVSRLFLLTLFPVQALATIALRAGIRLVLEQWRKGGNNQRFVLVLGAGPSGQRFATMLEGHRQLGLRVIGFLDPDPEVTTAGRWPVLGRLEDLEQVLHSRIVDEVAICLPVAMWDEIDAIAGLCEEEGKIVRIPMVVMERAISAGKFEDLDGTPVFSLVNGPDRAMALAAKRIVDVAGAIAGLVLLSPIMLGIAIAVKLDSHGPVLFRQERIGLHGRPFRVVKFRSMGIDAEARRSELSDRNVLKGPAFKVDGDPRVTRVGRFLRKSSLDELPQLWNVLMGSMSLVGPRPARGGVRPLGGSRPRVHRPLVAVARPQDPAADHPCRPGGPMTARRPQR